MDRRPGLPASLALRAIRGYQRYLSPHKGFSCAYRCATGRDGCSGYGYRVIGRFGLLAGLKLLRRRLRLCGETNRRHHVVPNPVLYYQRGDCDPGCGGDCVPDLPCSGRSAGSCLGDFLSGLCDCSCEPGSRAEEQKRKDEIERQEKKRRQAQGGRAP
ncbi:membrane protein insertion efficiency factor YidD [Massilia suwonensis]|uniref:Membrane protein insertion efficiency factor YidD n=1 Tax=Massilia suwonensis TaxID=648895 RepID=A0ABW0MFB2_9BURK